MLFGGLAVAVRDGLRRGGDPEAGALVVASVGFGVATIVAVPQLAGGFDVADLWPFLLAGAIVPGATQIVFILAIRHAGPSRASVLIGTAPLMSVLIAIALLGEPVKAELLVGTLLVVGGGAALVRERVRPEHFRLIGALLALACAALFAVRDNIVRWAARDAHPPPLVACATALLASVLVNLVYVSLRRRDIRPTVRPFALAGVLLAASYSSLLEAFDRGRVSVVAPLNATQSLWAVVFAAFFVGRSEAIGRRLVAAGALIVAGGALIGAAR
jgi:bacterial/archaeal transporter family protein